MYIYVVVFYLRFNRSLTMVVVLVVYKVVSMLKLQSNGTLSVVVVYNVGSIVELWTNGVLSVVEVLIL